MRTNRSEYVAHDALRQGVANQPVRAVRRAPASPSIRWGVCITVGMTIGAALVIGLGALL